jgi:3(or 17)beta-hydroxysteroid dehydrogenase
MSQRFSGRLALVTGAGLGIGEATSIALAREGARVVLAGTTASRLEGVAARIAEDGGVAWPVQMDVSDPEGWERVAKLVRRESDRLDILVNNAGILSIASILEMPLDTFRRIQQVNVEGVFLGMRLAAQLMQEGGGAIVNVSSVASRVGLPNYTAYAASKGAVDAMSRSAAMEFAALGWRIRVNTVQPGAVWTSMTESQLGPRAQSPIAPILDAFHPIGRMPEIDEVVAAILFLASDASACTTGASLSVDGGLAAGIINRNKQADAPKKTG